MEYFTLICSFIFLILALSSIIYILIDQLKIKKHFFDISASLVIYCLIILILELTIYYFLRVPLWAVLFVLFFSYLLLFKLSLKIRWNKAYSLSWRFILTSLLPLYLFIELLITPLYINKIYSDCSLKMNSYVLVNRIYYGITLPFYDEQLFVFENVKKNDLLLLKNNKIKSKGFVNEILEHFTFQHYFKPKEKQFLIQRVLAVGSEKLQVREDSFYSNNKKIAFKGCNKLSKKIKESPIYKSLNELKFIYIPKKGDEINLKLDREFNEAELVFNKKISYKMEYNKFLKSAELRIYKGILPDNIKEIFLKEQNWNRIVNKDYFFLINDDINNLNDSRSFGLVPIDILLGKVKKTY